MWKTISKFHSKFRFCLETCQSSQNSKNTHKRLHGGFCGTEKAAASFMGSAPGLKVKQLDYMSGLGGSKIQGSSNTCGVWLESFSLVQMCLDTFPSPQDPGLQNFPHKTTCRFSEQRIYEQTVCAVLPALEPMRYNTMCFCGLKYRTQNIHASVD